nr:tyrosine protein kinase [Cyclobacteriaceae bacterium]
MEQPHLQSTLSPDSIDTEKLSAVVKKNLTWIIALFAVANLVAYLFVRYTKPLYESVSELKLDIKRDARDLGIQEFVDDQNANIVAGEIEQIKSKVFLNRIIDSLPLGISYFSVGKVLREETYRQAPISVRVEQMDARYFDRPINIDLLDGNGFRLRFEDEGASVPGTFGATLTHGGLVLSVRKSPFYVDNDPNDYYFIINHRNTLINYLSANLSVEPLSLTANTIKISFKDFNLFKAYDIVNKIDSIYIYYSNEQKNLANKQKIEWLNNELVQVEQKMEGFENYFENFTIQNRSNNLDQDLRRTIELINKIDSQRFELTQRINRLDGILNDLTQAPTALSLRSYTFLPEFVNRKLEDLQTAIEQRDRLALSYQEGTFAFQQRERQLTQLKEQVFSQLNEMKKNWMLTLANLGKQKESLEQKFAGMPDKNTQFSKNQRFYKLYEEFYLAMMQSKAEFEIAQAGSTPDFKILSSATLPTQPISPKRYLIFGIGMVAGIVLNFFFIGLMYVLTNRITGINEIERSIDIPVLGTIPF